MRLSRVVAFSSTLVAVLVSLLCCSPAVARRFHYHFGGGNFNGFNGKPPEKRASWLKLELTTLTTRHST